MSQRPTEGTAGTSADFASLQHQHDAGRGERALGFSVCAHPRESRPLIVGQSPSVGRGGAGQVAGGLARVSAHKEKHGETSLVPRLKRLRLKAAPEEQQEQPDQRRCDQIAPV